MIKTSLVQPIKFHISMNILILKQDDDVDRFTEILNLLQQWLNTVVFRATYLDEASSLTNEDDKFTAAMEKYDYLNRLKDIYSVLLPWRRELRKKDSKMNGWPYVCYVLVI